jgi:hypothetical protein
MWNEWLARTLRPRPEREERPRAPCPLLARAEVLREESSVTTNTPAPTLPLKGGRGSAMHLDDTLPP